MTNEELEVLLAAALEKKLITDEVYDETLKEVFGEIKKRALASHTHNADTITDGTTKSIPTKTKQAEWDKKVTKEELNAAVNTFASGLAWKGVFDTLADLKAKITNPKEGDFVIVIKEPTYPKNTLLIYEGEPSNAWQTAGELIMPGKATQTSDGLMSKEDKKKLDGLSNYVHPTSHPATMITEDDTHKFVTAAEKTNIATALSTANAAKTAAATADSKAVAAQGTANTANTTANTAKTTADSALTKANTNAQAIATANEKITTLEGKMVYVTVEEAKAIINKYKA